jgi:hypothetical protein
MSNGVNIEHPTANAERSTNGKRPLTPTLCRKRQRRLADSAAHTRRGRGDRQSAPSPVPFTGEGWGEGGRCYRSGAP